MSSSVIRSLSALVLLLGAVISGLAQSDIARATLNGTVTDPSGALVSGAKVTIKNTAAGLTRQTTTSGAGLYSFAVLPVGNYDVTVEMAGFKTAQKSGVSLGVGAV